MTAMTGKTSISGTYAGYELDHLSVLVVDPSQAGRELLVSTLKDIGVGTVRKVANGLQAIEYLQGSRARFGGSANPPVDLVLTDIATAPIDGFMLARWIRRHAQSPNHFMRVMVISGGLNVDNIRAGRNTGVNDFIAKPFTMNSLRDRISAAIHNFRPFVLVSNYFGPDRRRHEMPPKADDRRTHVDPVDAKRAAAAAEAAQAQEDADIAAGARVFKIPNYLEAVVTGTSIDNLNFSALQKAEAESKSWVQDYADWIMPSIVFMRQELAKASDGDESARTRALEAIRREAYTMENTAVYLDYPLITAVAKSLSHALDLFGASWDAQSAMIEGHIQALFVIAREHLAGEENEKGLQVLAGLKGANGAGKAAR